MKFKHLAWFLPLVFPFIIVALIKSVYAFAGAETDNVMVALVGLVSGIVTGLLIALAIHDGDF
jgi:hypothetical protein